MIMFHYITNESEHDFLQKLSGYNNTNGINFDDCCIIINTDNNKVRASVIGNHFRMYKINDTEYCYYPSIFSKTNIKAKVFCDKHGKTHLKGIVLPHYTQFLSFVIPIILSIVFLLIPNFHISMIISCFLVFAALTFIPIHTIMHAAFSCARFKKFLKSKVGDNNESI